MATPDLLQLVELAYGCAIDPRGWDALLAQVAAALHAIQPALFTHDVQRASGQTLSAPQLDDSHRHAYGEHYSRCNVLLARYRSRLVPGAMRTSGMMVPRDEFVRSEYYNDFCRPIGMDHSLAATVDARGQFTVNVCFWRTARAPDFQPEDAALLAGLLPHLRRVLSVGEFVGQARQQAALASLVGRRLTQAVIGFAAGGRVCWTNDEADRLLRAGDGLSVERGELRACTPAATATLRRTVLAATTTVLDLAATEVAIALPRASGRRPYAVVVLPLRPDQPTLWDDATIRALAVVADPDRAPRISHRVLAREFELTMAEARVAALLAGGRAVEDICRDLGVSANTVRTHLKHIFLKTGTTRQAELVALLLGGLAGVIAEPAADRAPHERGDTTTPPRAAHAHQGAPR